MLDHTYDQSPPPTYKGTQDMLKRDIEMGFVMGQWHMFFWIPQEIHMKKGKMAGQVGHAAARLSRMMADIEWEHYTEHEVKIVYKVPTIQDLFDVRDELLKEYPVEHETVVFDNTSERHTVFGIATKRDLKNKKWKLA